MNCSLCLPCSGRQECPQPAGSPPRNILDFEQPGRRLGGDPAHHRNGPIEAVVTDHRPAPTLIEKLLAGDDRALRIKQQQERLHRQRLDMDLSGRAFNLAPRRADQQRAALQVGSTSQVGQLEHSTLLQWRASADHQHSIGTPSSHIVPLVSTSRLLIDAVREATMHSPIRNSLLLAVAVFGLTACGGGGGGGLNSTPTPAPAPTPTPTSSAVDIFPSPSSQEFASVGTGSDLRIRDYSASNKYEVLVGNGWVELVDARSRHPSPGHRIRCSCLPAHLQTNTSSPSLAHHGFSEPEFQYRYSNLALWAVPAREPIGPERRHGIWNSDAARRRSRIRQCLHPGNGPGHLDGDRPPGIGWRDRRCLGRRVRPAELQLQQRVVGG